MALGFGTGPALAVPSLLWPLMRLCCATAMEEGKDLRLHPGGFSRVRS